MVLCELFWNNIFPSKLRWNKKLQLELSLFFVNLNFNVTTHLLFSDFVATCKVQVAIIFANNLH